MELIKNMVEEGYEVKFISLEKTCESIVERMKELKNETELG